MTPTEWVAQYGAPTPDMIEIAKSETLMGRFAQYCIEIYNEETPNG